MSIRILNGGTPTPFPGALNAPTNVTAGVPTSTTIPLTWTAQSQGDASEYRVYNDSDVLQKIVTWPSTGTTLAGLNPETEYTFYVVTSDGTKESPKSNTATETTGAAADWQLDAGHYYDNQTNIPLTLIHPQPDGGAETINVWARHRWAHSQFRFQIPITAQGGAPPYKYEIIEDVPAGMVIGQFYGEANYGVLTWTPGVESQNTQWLVKILITDQAGRSTETTWTLELDDAMFSFQDPANPGGTGTWEDPYETFADWYGATPTTVADTQGKIMVYRAGTHVVPATSGSAMALPSSTYKPFVHIGVPDESVIWDQSGASIFLANTGSASLGTNAFFADINIDGSPSGIASDCRGIYASANARQFVAFNIDFTNQSSGISATNNEACIFTDSISSSNVRTYFSIINCTTDGLPSDGTNGYSLCILYSVRYLVIEGCSDTGTSTPAEWIFPKRDCSFMTIRYCDADIDMNQTRGLLYLYNNAFVPANYPTHQEICYNRFRCFNPNTEIALNINNGATNNGGTAGPIWIFRNTFVGIIIYGIPATNDDVNFFRNVAISSVAIDSDIVVPPGETNVYELSDVGVLDVSDLLEAAYLTSEGLVRGTYGHEVG